MTIECSTTSDAVTKSIRDLTAEDVRHLRLNHWSKVSTDEAVDIVRSYPGRSVWLPDTLEYAITGPWRHRHEIACVLALSAARNPSTLLTAIVDRSARLGGAAVIAIETDEVRHPSFYERAGFSVFEEVITLELESRWVIDAPSERLSFRLTSISTQADVGTLLRLDHTAFPWLWRNSEEELRAYAEAPGVELVLGYLHGEPVCYLGITAYLGWGHIDRIAVHPSVQGRGLGSEALSFAIGRLIQAGAQRIGLSTQKSNDRSQRLYDRFGFRRVSEHDYRVYGHWLRSVRT